MERRYTSNIDFWKFLDLIAQSRVKDKKEATDLVAFELFDGDNNGFISIVDIFELITTKETKGLEGVHADLRRIKRELREKAISGAKDELETAINFRRFQQLVPRPSFFDLLRHQMQQNYLQRKEIVRRFEPTEPASALV